LDQQHNEDEEVLWILLSVASYKNYDLDGLIEIAQQVDL
jgi:hypothetical protein